MVVISVSTFVVTYNYTDCLFGQCKASQLYIADLLLVLVVAHITPCTLTKTITWMIGTEVYFSIYFIKFGTAQYLLSIMENQIKLPLLLPLLSVNMNSPLVVK